MGTREISAKMGTREFSAKMGTREISAKKGTREHTSMKNEYKVRMIRCYDDFEEEEGESVESEANRRIERSIRVMEGNIDLLRCYDDAKKHVQDEIDRIESVYELRIKSTRESHSNSHYYRMAMKREWEKRKIELDNWERHAGKYIHLNEEMKKWDEAADRHNINMRKWKKHLVVEHNRAAEQDEECKKEDKMKERCFQLKREIEKRRMEKSRMLSVKKKARKEGERGQEAYTRNNRASGSSSSYVHPSLLRRNDQDILSQPGLPMQDDGYLTPPRNPRESDNIFQRGSNRK
jgi:hypothetical protein